jgi:hypothetical protein
MAEFKSCKDLIIALGGARPVARKLSLGDTTVQRMCDRDRIADWHWDDIIALAKELKVRGITTEVLAKLSKRERPISRRKIVNDAAA